MGERETGEREMGERETGIGRRKTEDRETGREMGDRQGVWRQAGRQETG